MIPESAEWIRRQAEGEGFGVPPRAAETLYRYSRILEVWAGRINLMGPAGIQRLWEDHLLDGLWLDSRLPEMERIGDFGSGAGIPGLIIASLKPDIQVDLIEANQKKSRFLRLAAAELGLSRVRVISRAVRPKNKWPEEGYPIIVSRAAAAPQTLLDLTWALTLADGLVMALVGRSAPYGKTGDMITGQKGAWLVQELEFREFYGKRRGLVTLRKRP